MDGRDRVNVLVVEHDPWTRVSLSNALSDAGLTVTEASNGISALRLALSIGAQVAVIGSELPEMPAAELVRCLRSDSRTCQTAIVAVGLKDQPGAEARADASIQLPFSLVDLLATVLAALEARCQPAGGPGRLLQARPPGPSARAETRVPPNGHAAQPAAECVSPQRSRRWLPAGARLSKH